MKSNFLLVHTTRGDSVDSNSDDSSASLPLFLLSSSFYHLVSQIWNYFSLIFLAHSISQLAFLSKMIAFANCISIFSVPEEHYFPVGWSVFSMWKSMKKIKVKFSEQLNVYEYDKFNLFSSSANILSQNKMFLLHLIHLLIHPLLLIEFVLLLLLGCFFLELFLQLFLLLFFFYSFISSLIYVIHMTTWDQSESFVCLNSKTKILFSWHYNA